MDILRSLGAFKIFKLIDPPNASPSISGVGDLNSSIPDRSSGEMSERSTDLSVPDVEGNLTPFMDMAVNFGSNPLTTTLDPSPPSLLMATPGRRDMASAALTSGSSLIFSADTKLAMASELSC